MRLSDAIALGRTLVNARPGSESFNDGSGCARGMALEACGTRSNGMNFSTFCRLWPWTVFNQTDCPVCPIGFGKRPVATQIAHIFDMHVTPGEFTLDQLIDWVRSVEPQEEPAETPEAESADVLTRA